jgi:hypothetical protein
MTEITLDGILRKKELLGGLVKIEIREPRTCLLMTRDGYIIDELEITRQEKSFLVGENLVEENDYKKPIEQGAQPCD